MKKRIFRLAAPVLVAAAAIFIQCAKDSPTGADNTKKLNTGTLKGRVVDKAGNGLAGVAVTSVPAGYSTVSVADGYFEISGIEAGAYRFNFNYADYRDTASREYAFALNDTIALDQNMKMTFRFAKVIGIVRDSSNVPLVGAGVTVEKQGIYTMTYTGGEYTLLRVEPGNIRLMSAMAGKGAGLKELPTVPDSEYTGVDIKQDLNGGTVSGTIEEATPKVLRKGAAAQGPPLAGAVVSAVAGALRDTTDGWGRFTLNDVPSGAEVILTVVNAAGDTMRISGVRVQENGRAALPPVVFKAFTVVDLGGGVPSTGTFWAACSIDMGNFWIPVYDTLVINPNGTYKERNLSQSNFCDAMQFMGRQSVSDSFFIVSGMVMRSGNSCTGAFGPWNTSSVRDTSILSNVYADSFSIRHRMMMAVGGGAWVKYRKISSAIDTSGFYSNASLDGAWLVLGDEADFDIIHILFDGAGSIVDGGGFDDNRYYSRTEGWYAVNLAGGFTGGACGDSFPADTMAVFGAILFDTLASIGFIHPPDTTGVRDTVGPVHMVKVRDMAACQGEWSGDFMPDSTVPVASRAPRTITLTIDNQGWVAGAASGLTPPVNGRMYMQEYSGKVYLSGQFYSGDPGSWNQFGLDSVVVNGNAAYGTYNMDCACDGGAFFINKR